MFQLIKKRLYLVPLWSSIILADFGLTRLTNNPVENYFGHLKNRIIQKRLVSCSELACLLYTNIQAKYYQRFKEVQNEDVQDQPRTSVQKNKQLKLFFLKATLNSVLIFLIKG